MSYLKQDLVWDHEDRSIGIWDLDELGEHKYRPIILFNFKVIANIAPRFDSFRGYEILLKTFDGKDFKIVLSYEDCRTWKLFHKSVYDQVYNCDVSYNPFDESLWQELFVR
jgi:hypothetical protein